MKPSDTLNLQAEYDNSAKVANSASLVAGWLARAAAFRASHAHAELDLPYGPTPRQAMDIFWPGEARDGPVAMFIHGGYWQRLDRSAVSHFAAGVNAHGMAMALPSYDLCPQVSMAALVEQLRGAAAFLHRRLGRRFLVSGHSAGGHLTAMVLATDWTARGLPADMTPSGIAISGLFDLPPLLHTTIADPLGLDEAEARRLSPLFLPPPAARLHATVGGDEGAEYERQSRSIAEAWGGTWDSAPGLNHFTIAEQLEHPDSALVRRMVET